MSVEVQHVKLGKLVYLAEVSKDMSLGTIGLNYVQRENLAIHVGDSM